LARSAGEIRDNNIAAYTLFSVAGSWGQLLVFVIIGLLIIVNASVSDGHQVVTGFAICILYLVGPLQMIMSSFQHISRAKVSTENIDKLDLDLRQTAEADRANLILKTDLKGGRIDFVDVMYRYSGEDGEEFELRAR
jgi:ABC-type siderophore export system fused ATPase/permease subunit